MLSVGIDVSNAQRPACRLPGGQDQGKAQVGRNDPAGITQRRDWVPRQGIALSHLHTGMAATGSSPEGAAHARFAAGVTVSLLNPAPAKDLARGLAVRTTTDGVAGPVLARVGALLKPPAWQPPDLAIRDWPAWLARRAAVAQDLPREHTRREHALATATPPRVPPSIEAAIACWEQALSHLPQESNDHMTRHPGLKDDLTLLTSMPAVGPPGGRHLLAILPRHPFQSAEPGAAYLGLVPVERHSGTSLHGRSHLSQAGPARRRAILYLAAVVATRDNPHLQSRYERLLAPGKAKKVALGAAMRTLVHRCFGVLKNRQPYQAEYA